MPTRTAARSRYSTGWVNKLDLWNLLSYDLTSLKSFFVSRLRATLWCAGFAALLVRPWVYDGTFVMALLRRARAFSLHIPREGMHPVPNLPPSPESAEIAFELHRRTGGGREVRRGGAGPGDPQC